MSKNAPERVSTTPNFRRQFQRKSPELQAHVVRTVQRLEDNWQHPGLRTRRVQGRKGVYEARIDRRYRITFYWEGGTMWLENNCKHDIVGT